LESLYDFLAQRLCGVKKLAVLGAGSVLRADDVAGVMVVKNLIDVFGQDGCPNLGLFAGETAPENFSGEIRRFCPSHLLLIDAADAGRVPGSIMHLQPEEVGGISFCSHMLPLRIMSEYLEKETGTAVTLLGIQYKNIDFDAEITLEVQEAIDEITEALVKTIRERLF
jgi:hydrogenase 3 maturation protease